MVDSISICYDKNFKKCFKKLDPSYKIKLKKQIIKVIDNPEIGKPMKYTRKNTRELYISPFRLSYYYSKKENKLIFLDFYHKDKQ
ncbi:MAG: hypothetical protein PUB95_05355 [Methanobrevibacter ruminantium]|uniref:type II toxin-antitoxin system RelE/ParE family toxin n=1 Tax=Methanobrevibacter ruminantium TaxID=83816 RepID=UPI0026F25A36|nr:type II toxin-antitoxin system RelE/ParE family toxin [Methanobrevibacter ruminantium]MDD6048862.1 hypothetical protein [Methanobrevibacter ruminantium]